MAKRPLPDPVLKARLRTMLDADRQELLLRYPFFGRIICSCELVPVDDANLETACSDGRRIFIAERWYSALPDTQRLAVLAHEVLHIVLRHFFRLGNRDRMRFNYAADIEIHFLLEAENFEEPVVLPYQPEWEGLTAEEIYECLPRELPQDAPEHLYPDVNSPCCKRAPSPDASQSEEQQDAEGQPETGGGDRQGEKTDTSPSSDDGNQLNTCIPASTDEGQDLDVGETETPCESEPQSPNQGTSGQRMSDSCEDPDFAPEFDEDTEMHCKELLLDGRMNTAEGRGSLPAGLVRFVEELLTPKINWKNLLRRYLKECRGGSYHWLPPNRRFVARGLYLPGRRTQCFRGVVALDTSGSTIEAIPEFLTELNALMKAFIKYEVTVIECDAKLQCVEKFRTGEPIDFEKFAVKGGGGTDFRPVFQYIREEGLYPNVLLFFTDGAGTCCETPPHYPVIWLLTDDGEAPVPWGAQIKFNQGES